VKKAIAVGFLLAIAWLIAAEPADYLLYVGTFTTEANGSKGIYSYRFHDGKLTAVGLAAESLNPSFLVEHPNHRYLYAVNNNRGLPENTVTAFSIDRKSGKLTFLNKVDSRGEGPAHAASDGRYRHRCDRTCMFVICAVMGWPGEFAMGRMGVAMSRDAARASAHATSANL
jgi:6-phosphogluconolactonase